MSDVVIVSGGTRGLGLSIVRSLLARKTRVATFARSQTPELAELMSTHPGQVWFQELDATDTPAVKGFVNDVSRDFGRIFGLINNAAIGQDHLLTSLPEDQIGHILDVNVRAPIVLTRAVVKKMLISGIEGRIINVSSICAVRGYAGLTVYSATKGALDSFTRTLARELGPRKIYVNAVAPGFFASEMSKVLTPDQMDAIRRRTPTGELATADDVTNLTCSLLFDLTNVTGQILYVDGGAST